MGINLRYSPLEFYKDSNLLDFGGAGVSGMLAAALNTTGNVFYVDNGNGQAFDGYGQWGKSPSKPIKTLDWAVGRCTANNGDRIIVMPGHAETLTGATDIVLDVAGITIICLGEGADRATFTFSSTDNGAYIPVSAASISVYNFLGVCNDDALTKAFYVTAADVTLDFTWRDPTNIEAASVVLTDANADRLTINMKYEGYSSGNACVKPIQLVGVNKARIKVDFYGLASTSVVDMNTTACTDVNVEGYIYNAGTTDYSKLVTDSATGSTWFAKIFDGAAGHMVYGGSGGGFGTEDLSALLSDLALVRSDIVVVQSDTAALASSVSDLTILTSDMAIHASDIASAVSDFILLTSDIGVIESDLKITNAIVDTTYSDTGQIQTRTVTIASDLVVLDAIVDAEVIKTATIASDLVVLDAIVDAEVIKTATIASDLVVLDAIVDAEVIKTATIASDLVILDAVADNIYSDTTKINSDTAQISSDVLDVYSDTTKILSDTAQIQTRTTTIASDLVILDTVADTIASDLIILDTVADGIVTAVASVASDLVIVDSVADNIYSMLSDFVLKYASDVP